MLSSAVLSRIGLLLIRFGFESPQIMLTLFTKANGKMFCAIAEIDGVPDGIRCDTNGNVWVGVASGVEVYSAAGTMVARIRTPETVANLGFGGPGGNELMLCSSTNCYIVKTESVGATHKDQAASGGGASL